MWWSLGPRLMALLGGSANCRDGNLVRRAVYCEDALEGYHLSLDLSTSCHHNRSSCALPHVRFCLQPKLMESKWPWIETLKPWAQIPFPPLHYFPAGILSQARDLINSHPLVLPCLCLTVSISIFWTSSLPRSTTQILCSWMSYTLLKS